MNNTERFLSIYQEKIHREGADKLLDYLRTGTDFFTAPASTRYHGAHEGGLLEHSLTVMKLLEAARKDGGIHFPADEG